MMRKDKTKPGPSGMSQNQAFSLPGDWNGWNCLLKIEDLSIIKKLKEELGGDELVSFSTSQYGSPQGATAEGSVTLVSSTKRPRMALARLKQNSRIV
jgi:hypothetical protein